jgi:alkylhydroperoxidase family enzyme
MSNSAVAPRLAPFSPGELDASVRARLAAWGLGEEATPPKIFATLARHPELLACWDSTQRALLLDGVLPARDRELVILRTAVICRCAYIWGQHASHHGPEAGLSSSEIALVAHGSRARGWSAFDAALLSAAEELHEACAVADATWTQLSSRYDERQLIELLVIAGEYHLMSFVLNGLRIDAEPGVAAMPALA